MLAQLSELELHHERRRACQMEGSVRVWRRCWQRERKGGRREGKKRGDLRGGSRFTAKCCFLTETDEMVTQAGEFTCGGELGVE